MTRRRARVSRALRVALAAAALIGPTTGEAGPRTIDDCEKIKEADAYNLCLAGFGPTRGQRNKSYPGMARESGATSATTSSPHGRKNSARWRDADEARASMRRAHGGRMRMEFTPGR